MHDSMRHFLAVLEESQSFAESSVLDWLGQKMQRERVITPSSSSLMLTASGGPIEKGAILVTTMQGSSLPLAATQREGRESLVGAPYSVCGLSIILHPRHPLAPTIHGNIRMFCVEGQRGIVTWYGGGIDLTPFSVDTVLAKKWHDGVYAQTLQFGTDRDYYLWRKQCDEYFYLKHRGEPRGVGGVFFDDLSMGSSGDQQRLHLSLAGLIEYLFSFYIPVVADIEKRLLINDDDRSFQVFRRGRYVEFNLLYDRGTLFGLQSGGRADSILLSMPPLVSWPVGLNETFRQRNADLIDFFVKTTHYASFDRCVENAHFS